MQNSVPRGPRMLGPDGTVYEIPDSGNVTECAGATQEITESDVAPPALAQPGGTASGCFSYTPADAPGDAGPCFSYAARGMPGEVDPCFSYGERRTPGVVSPCFSYPAGRMASGDAGGCFSYSPRPMSGQGSGCFSFRAGGCRARCRGRPVLQLPGRRDAAPDAGGRRVFQPPGGRGPAENAGNRPLL